MAKQKNAALEFMTINSMSKFKEQFSEYFFLKDLMLQSAKQGILVAVSRSDFDTFGFDLLLSKRNEITQVWKSIRVQLKATFNTRIWDVHKSLLEDPEGRVILIELSANDNDVVSSYFLFDSQSYKQDALVREPIVAHPGKCKVRFGEFVPINDNLLSIFED